MPPWFSAMDIWLSLKTMTKLLPSSPATSRPSRASPPLRDPSPMTATAFSCLPARSRALARPSARLMEVEVWPTSKRSWSDSAGLL